MNRLLLISAICFLAFGLWAQSLLLTWDATSGAVGYRVYSGPASGSYTRATGLLTNISAVLANPTNRTYYAVTAEDATGLESDFSNEVSGPSVAGPTVLVVAIQQTPALGMPWSVVTNPPPLTLTNPTGSGYFRLTISRQ